MTLVEQPAFNLLAGAALAEGVEVELVQQSLSEWYLHEGDKGKSRLIAWLLELYHLSIVFVELAEETNEIQSGTLMPVLGHQTSLDFILLNDLIDLFVMEYIVLKLLY